MTCLVDNYCERARLRRYHMSCDRRYGVELFAADEDHAVFSNSEDDGCIEGPDGNEDFEPPSCDDKPVSNTQKLQTSGEIAM